MTFSGTPGQSFTLTASHGELFGARPGHVTVDGRRLDVISWSPTVIVGNFPHDLKPGPVVVTTGDSSPDVHDATEIHGEYGVKDAKGNYYLASNESPAQRTARHAQEDHEHRHESPAARTERLRVRALEPSLAPAPEGEPKQ